MSFITTTDGVRLHYEEAGSGQPVLLVGGWCSSTDWWVHQLEGLSDRYRVIALDPRSVGRSDKCLHGLRVGRYARDLYDVILALDLSDVVAVGWSIAARTMLSYHELFTFERIARLVWIDETPCSINRDDWDFGFGNYDRVRAFCESARLDLDKTLREYVPTMFHRPPEGEAFERALALFLRSPPKAAAAILWDAMNQDFRDVLPRVVVPTLVCTGAYSRPHLRPASEYMCHRLPDARLLVFSDSAHSPQYEEPVAFNRALREFVD